MRPVVLLTVPNSNQTVGFFADEKKAWWKSQPIPNALDILETEWVFGSKHFALVKNVDGDHNVYRTHDYGYTWSLVWDAPAPITCMKRLDYGRVIFCTLDDGWYETVNSGSSVYKIGSDAPGCKNVVNLGAGLLIAHHGDALYKSDSDGHNWDINLDFSDPVLYDGTSNRKIDIDKIYVGNNDLPVAIDGVWSQALASMGGYLIVTDDGGNKWRLPCWQSDYPDCDYVNWEIGEDKVLSRMYNIRVTDICYTGCSSSPEYTDSHNFVVVYANKWRPNNVIRVYHVTWPLRSDYKLSMVAKFDAPITNNLGRMVTSYNVLRPNSSFSDSVTYITYSYTDYDNDVNRPAIALSENYGVDFSDIDLSGAKVTDFDADTEYDAEDDVLSTSYLRRIWNGPACHNTGHWEIASYWSRSLSYDFDYNTLNDKSVGYNVKIASMKRNLAHVSIDAHIIRQHVVPYGIDIKPWSYNTKELGYLNTVILKKQHYKTLNLDELVKAIHHAALPSSCKIKATQAKTIFIDMLLRIVRECNNTIDLYVLGSVDEAYDLELVPVTDRTCAIASWFERMSPQYIDQTSCPNSYYRAFDSRKEKLFDE